MKFKRKDWKLGWSFFLICDACIINSSHECESSFKKSFFLISKNKFDFSFTNLKLFFITFQNRIVKGKIFLWIVKSNRW